MTTSVYSGTLVSDLFARADNLLAIYGQRKSSVDSGDPWQILVNARTHLSDALTVEGHVDAWFDLGEIQDCLLDGLTDECLFCGEMEGLHRPIWGMRFCRHQPVDSSRKTSWMFEAKVKP